MSVKVEVDRSKWSPEPEYPMLMESKETGLIILVHHVNGLHGSGTVLVKDSIWDIGYTSDNWGMVCFKPFNGRVTLEGV